MTLGNIKNYVHCRRYMNVYVKSHTFTANLGLVRCKGSVTAKVTAEIVKVGIFLSTVPIQVR